MIDRLFERETMAKKVPAQTTPNSFWGGAFFCPPPAASVAETVQKSSATVNKEIQRQRQLSSSGAAAPRPVLSAPDSFSFPYEKPYSVQTAFMKKLFTTLEAGKVGIFESPTGTGKSLSIICGSLSWQQMQPEDAEEGEAATAVPTHTSSTPSLGPSWVAEFEEQQRRERVDERRQQREKVRIRLEAARSGHISEQKAGSKKDARKGGQAYSDDPFLIDENASKAGGHASDEDAGSGDDDVASDEWVREAGASNSDRALFIAAERILS